MQNRIEDGDAADDTTTLDPATAARAEALANADGARAVAVPLDQALHRRNARPQFGEASLRNAEQLNKPSISFDSRVVAGLEGYSDEMRGYVAAAETALSEMHEAVAGVIRAREGSKQRPDWNESGQILAVGDHAFALQQRAAKAADAAMSALSKGIAATEAALREPVQAASEGHTASEIRAYVRGLQTDERMVLLQRATEDGDTVTLGAVLGKPAYLSGLTREMQDALTTQFNIKRQPALAQRLGLQRAALAKVEAAGSLLLGQIVAAMGCDWAVVNRLKEQRAKAEAAFAPKRT